MKTPMTKLMLAAVAATLLCLGARAATIDLSTLTENFTAQDGDVLTGTAPVDIKLFVSDGATVTLANATHNYATHLGNAGGIDCKGDAIVMLVGDNNMSGLTGIYVPSGKTLTIRGLGTLTASGTTGIGASGYNSCGNIVIEGGTIVASGSAAGIGCAYYGHCGNITITGGDITATAGQNRSDDYAAIGTANDARYGHCGDITIGLGITKVVATKSPKASNCIGIGTGGSYGVVTIAEDLQQTYSNDGRTLTIVPVYKYDVAWLNDDGTEIDTTIVPSNVVPVHAEPTKAAAVPYRWVFTGWTPELEAAVSNATYTATFKIVADLSLCTNDWTAADGDEIVGETAHEVSIPGGAHVTINGVAVAGTGGGGSVPAPAFAAGGASEIVKFAQAEGGKWTITAFAEMSNESRGTDVTDGQIKVFSADTLEALKSVTTPAAGATVKETKSAVKATVEVPAPSGKTSQFFKVKFGE